jgi:hypothetical protein
MGSLRDGTELSITQPIILNKECLDVLQKTGRQVAEGADIRKYMRVTGDGDQRIVPKPTLSFLSSLPFDGAQKTDLQAASHDQRKIRQNPDIEGPPSSSKVDGMNPKS